jgi:hypothetical protein
MVLVALGKVDQQLLVAVSVWETRQRTSVALSTTGLFFQIPDLVLDTEVRLYTDLPPKTRSGI